MNNWVIHNVGNFLTSWETVRFQEGICSMEYDRWLIRELRVLKKEQELTHSLLK